MTLTNTTAVPSAFRRGESRIRPGNCRRPNSGDHKDHPYDHHEPVSAIAKGAYFVKACTRDRACLFGHVVNGEMHMNEAGQIARRCWEDIPTTTTPQSPSRTIGSVVRGSEIVIPCKGEASVAPVRAPKELPRSDASPLRQRPNGTQPGSLSAIVQNCKSISTRKMNAARNAPGTPIWQRNYHEHVVRNEAELMAIREYILANAARWDEDENNSDFTKR